MQIKIRDQKGFTLLEVLVAGALLTVGLLGIAAMMISAVHGNAFGGRMSVAENLGSQRLEYFKNLGYGSVTREIGLAGGTYTTSGASVCGAGTATEDYGHVDNSNAGYIRFKRETKLEFLDYTADKNNPAITTVCPAESTPKLATVTVSWKDNAARNPDGTPMERSVSIKALFVK